MLKIEYVLVLVGMIAVGLALGATSVQSAVSFDLRCSASPR